MDYPEDYKYSTDHEWISVENGIATMGITGFAIEQLGDIVYLELPDVGSDFEAQATIGTVESTKAVSDLLIPCSGEIVEVNDKLNDMPEIIQDDPYLDGWMVKFKLEDPSEVEALMSAGEYDTHTCESE